ncbi:MAG: trypsin-like peptidase domain-containing protein [Gemmatimonadetes bacterium]|nr:trypsin-like peptidase domain-containing protein [Gemmatimonadota bacterium]
MRVELHITSGSRAGQQELLEMPLIRIGRHPANDVRFPPELDTDVSGMHCEIKVIGARLVIHDSNSTNGTFVNGERVREDHPIYDGDVIGLGAHGPQLTIGAAAARPPEATRVESHRDARASVAAPVGSGRLDTQARVAIAVKEQTHSLRAMVIGLAAIVALVVIGVVAYGKRSGDKAEQNLKAALARNDSLSALVAQTVGAMKGKVGGLDSALALSKAEGNKLRSELSNGSKSTDFAQRVIAAENRQRQLVSAAQLDYEAIAAKSSPAIVFIAVQLPSGKKVSGTGFNVLPSGLIVTNKHVVQDENGGAAVRIAVEFDKTKAAWMPGHVVKVSETDDLAWIKIDREGPFPSVAGVSRTPNIRVGIPAAIIGYPLGNSTAGMEGDISSLHAVSTLGVATVSKVLENVIQFDAFAAEGSSGSPIFDSRGFVIAVLYGGAAESGGRIIYAVPARKLADQMPAEAQGIIR